MSWRQGDSLPGARGPGAHKEGASHGNANGNSFGDVASMVSDQSCNVLARDLHVPGYSQVVFNQSLDNP